VITDERIATYIDSLDRGNTAFLNEMEKYAKDTFVPIIKRPTQNLIRVLLSIKKPKRILEVGTAIGFSAILMAEYSKADITTIEKYEKRIPIARDYFEKSGHKDRIHLIEGDACDVLRDLVERKEKYDLIFMDAAKGQYMNFFPYIMELLDEDGILISDNVLQDGDVVQSRFAVCRRDRTIHMRMREYLYTLTHDERLDTSVLPLGDGVTISSFRSK